MPHVHASGFPETYGFEEELFFDWLQMASLFFLAHGASRMLTCTIQNSNQIKQKQNTFKQKYSEERVERRKHTTNTFGSGISEEKINKRFTGESWKQFEFEPCYTCEKTSQLSYKSRVLHSIMVVRACGGISERGGSRNSHYFAYSVHTLTKICNWRWILHLCSYQDFISKRLQ